jgi:hypothetical protein
MWALPGFFAIRRIMRPSRSGEPFAMLSEITQLLLEGRVRLLEPEYATAHQD